MYLGCRKGELLNLKITDITPHQDGAVYLTIRRNPHDGSDSSLYQPLVKTRSRSIAVNQNLKKKLETYILNYRSTVSNAELTDYLILSNKGQPLSINALDKISLKFREPFYLMHMHLDILGMINFLRNLKF